jgi:isoquinoline 1-oxidoreductase beta subunit
LIERALRSVDGYWLIVLRRKVRGRAIDMPYDIPNFHVEYVRAEPPAVPTGFWRGVGPNNNVFAIECFMDELARKAGKDPV